MKTLLAASLVTLFLCGPALADPAPDAPIQLKVTLRDAAKARTFTLASTIGTCGDVKARDGARQDWVRVCGISETPRGVRLDVEWELNDGAIEHRQSSMFVLAHGAKTEVGGDDAHLQVQLL